MVIIKKKKIKTKMIMELEYRKRVEEQKRLIAAYNMQSGNGYPIEIMEGDYEPMTFYEMAKGLEQQQQLEF